MPIQATVLPGGSAQGPWTPVQGSEFGVLVASQMLSEDTKEELRRSSVEILRRGHDPSLAAQQRAGLVVGYVQSGKTLSFTSVTALARDNGFAMIIVIAGTSTSLVNQSDARLKDDLRIERREDRVWYTLKNPEDSGDTLSNVQGVLADWDDPQLSPAQRTTVLVTVMKNVLHLENLADLLARLPLAGKPVLIIDDEADQASLNTGIRKGKESATYAWLKRVRTSCPRHTFLQYTATPQAPLLISLIDGLSPEFVVVLKPGPEYVGGRDFFVEHPTLSTILPVDEEGIDEDAVDAPDSLLKALRLYFLGVADGYAKGASGHRSMLIHPSRGRMVQAQYVHWVKTIRDSWGALLASHADDPDRNELIDTFASEYEELAESFESLLPFPELSNGLLRAVRKTHVHEVNAATGATPEVDWKASYTHILVGGQSLDRGYTVKGLTVTYMPRGVGQKQADTIQQRARFFGYKRSFLGLCRVYLDAGAHNAFQKYVEHEEDMRGRLEAHAATGKPLSAWKRQFFLDKNLVPTRRAVLAFMPKRLRFGGEWIQTAVPHVDADAAKQNLDVVVRLKSNWKWQKDAGSDQRTETMRHLVIRDLSIATVLEEMLLPMQFLDPEDSNRIAGLAAALNSVPPATKITVFLMSQGAQRVRGTTEDGEVINLFQGPSPDAKGSVYPGDRAMRESGAAVTIQLHVLSVGGDRGARGEGQSCVALTAWWPENLAKDLLTQDWTDD